MNYRPYFLAAYVGLFIAFLVGSTGFFLQTKLEYDRLKRAEQSMRQRLAEHEEKLREQERVLLRLRQDPAYVELIIRRRLGYARPEEFVFRFDSK